MPVGIVTLKNRTPSSVAKLFIECAREIAKPVAKRKGVDDFAHEVIEHCCRLLTTGLGTKLPNRNVRFHGRSWRISGRADEISKVRFMTPKENSSAFSSVLTCLMSWRPFDPVSSRPPITKKPPQDDDH